MLARNDFLDFQFIGAGPREAFWLQRSLGEHPSIALPMPNSSASRQQLRTNGRLRFGLDQLGHMRGHYQDAGPLTVLGDINADLLLDPTAASRLSSAFPQLKLIGFLRDPAELILDLYHWRAQTHRVEAKLIDELDRQPQWLDRTRYHRHLLPFLDRFHPDQICLVIYERFFAQETHNYQRLCDYLNVDSEFRPSPIAAEINQQPTQSRWSQTLFRKLFAQPNDHIQSTIDEQTRWQILDQLDGDMNRLEQSLGIKLDIWRGSSPPPTLQDLPTADNVIPLPSGDERRQRLANRQIYTSAEC